MPSNDLRKLSHALANVAGVLLVGGGMIALARWASANATVVAAGFLAGCFGLAFCDTGTASDCFGVGYEIGASWAAPKFLPVGHGALAAAALLIGAGFALMKGAELVARRRGRPGG